MFVILSASRQYHTGDWNEDAPGWSPKLDNAYAFDTREAALETMRRHIAADQAAKRTPGFTGCRVANHDDERARLAMKELRASGYSASWNPDATAIWIDFDAKKVGLVKAFATFPRSVYGYSVHLRANGKPVKWNAK